MLDRWIRADFGRYKYLGFFAMLNVTFMLVANFVSPRLVTLGGVSVSVSVYYFPMIYLIADILTEVYGYGQARKIMWLSLFCKIVAACVVWLALLIPPSPMFANEAAFQTILSSGFRTAVASILAFFVGDVGTSYALAKLKVWSNGRHMWMRFIASTGIGQALNTVVFYGIAFVGIVPLHALALGMLVAWAAKVVWEIVALPLTYVVVRRLKKAEGVDHFDRHTNFNPFVTKT